MEAAKRLLREMEEKGIVDDPMSKASGNQDEVQPSRKRRRVQTAEDEKHLADIKEQRIKELEELLTKSEFLSSYFESVQDDRIIEALKKSRMANASQPTQSPATDSDDPGTSSENSNDQAVDPPTKTTALGLLVSKDQPSLLDGAILREYQLAGLKWMRKLFLSGMNGILADEMGLGKTIQVISLICHLYEQEVDGPYIIIGPLSTLSNWQSEFESFAMRIPVILYNGNISKRDALRNKITRTHSLEEDGKKKRKVFPVVITSFETFLNDSGYLNHFNWKYIFVDEGHRLKNPDSVIKRKMASMMSMNRLILSGTPIQNSMEELWSLLNFLLPSCFNCLKTFKSWLSVDELISITSKGTESFLKREKEDMIIKKMHKILQPFILRRVKADVNLRLPGKKEVIIDCPLTKYQLDWYRYILNYFDTRPVEKVDDSNSPRKLRSQVKKTASPPTSSIKMKNLRNVSYPGRSHCYVDDRDGQHYIINLKMNAPYHLLMSLVNHPFMVTVPTLPGGDRFEASLKKIISSSGKMLVLDSLLKRLKKRGHKVIVFSPSTFMLEIIEKYLDYEGFNYHVLTGATPIEERKKSIAEFNTNPDSFVFLISTRAGGLGINLCAADTVIIVNSDWNPQVDLQAQDRCHRIGQTKPVVVYRLKVPGTVDEAVFHRALAKRKLEKIIIQKGNFGSKDPKAMDLDELKVILEEKIASNEMMIGNKNFSEEEWEKLLDRSDIPTIDDVQEVGVNVA